MRQIYLDNAATTKTDERVLDRMFPYFCEIYGNPSSTYSLAKTAHAGIETARTEIAEALRCKTGQVFFTSGGTESNNIVLNHFSHIQLCGKCPHVIVSGVEHHSVTRTVDYLQSCGVLEATFLPVDKNGVIDLNQLEDAIQENTVGVSIMTVNNEVGSVMPIEGIGSICKQHGILFHTDAVQAFCHLPIKLDNVDFLSVSSHKIHGPKGTGALFVRNAKGFHSMFKGGVQERSIRPGTENVPGIVGMGAAARIACEDLDSVQGYVSELRNQMLNGIMNGISDCQINGDPVNHSCNILSVTFRGADKNLLLYLLDTSGIFVSSGAACSAGTEETSHVLLAMGLSPEDANSTVRFSFSKFNTPEEIDYVLNILPDILKKARTH